jgi:regulator of replication initiation timing
MESIEELLRLANNEDLGENAGRLAEEVMAGRQEVRRLAAENITLQERNEELVADLDDFSKALDASQEKVLARQREAERNEGRIRRLRNALIAAGVNEELVARIEWDR